jgi:hypothetical protein
MIAVLASRLDCEVRDLLTAWSGSGAALLPAEDLISPGWEFRPADPASGTAVIEGRQVKVAELCAVLTRRPAVLAEELARIGPAERTYVATEINAFLVAWLYALPCPVLNRPTTRSLSGPAWDDWHWRVAAARAGIECAEAGDVEAHAVIVCCDECLFAATERQASIARELARIAGVELLSVSFSGDRLCGASVAPPLEDPEVRKRLLRRLAGNP